MDSIASSQDQITTYWQPDGVQKNIATSGLNFVGLMEDGRTVLKYPHEKTPDTSACLREEADRYIRLGPHENLVSYRGITEDGLLLEYCEQGSLDEVVRNFGNSILTESRRIIIGKQIVRCLIFLHEQNFIHCDIHARNVFLTSEMDAKIGDLQGQLYRHDGSFEMETMSQENPKSRHPDAGKIEFSRRTDIFALGTLLCHLWYGDLPFPDLDEFQHEDLIKARYREQEHPELNQNPSIDEIIRNCWASKYESASEILDNMDDFSEDT